MANHTVESLTEAIDALDPKIRRLQLLIDNGDKSSSTLDEMKPAVQEANHLEENRRIALVNRRNERS